MLILLLSLLTASAQDDSDITLDDVALLEVAAAELGAPVEVLEIHHVAWVDYPLTGVSGYAAKIYDSERDEDALLLVDFDLNPLPEGLADEEAALHDELYGVYDPELVDHLETLSFNEPVTVSVVLTDPGPGIDPLEGLLPEDPADLDADAVSAELYDFWANWNSSIVDAVTPRLEEWSEELVVSETTPVIYATLPAQMVRELGDWPEVSAVHWHQAQEPRLATVNAEIGSASMHAQGIDGHSSLYQWAVKLGVVEIGGYAPPPADHPFISAVATDTATQCPNRDGHAYGVLGVLISEHGTDHGVAPDAEVWAGGGCDGTIRSLLHGTERAIKWGARMVNHSWGEATETAGMRGDDRAMDRLAARHRVGQYVAAGNSADFVGSPAKGFNVTAVGAFDDHGTGYRGDNTMYTGSNFRDPTSAHGDRELPHVVAPGVDIQTTRADYMWLFSNGWMYYFVTGTSVASPAAMGVGALIATRNPLMAYRPETVKSILMTTALTNIEGARLLSELDGAGGVRSTWADSVVRKDDGGWRMSGSSCSNPYSPSETVSLASGERIRSALSWLSDPDYHRTRWRTEPSVDLDLLLVDPNGHVVARSASFDRGYEILEHTASDPGDYQLKVRQFRCDDTRSGFQLGFSWLRLP